MQGWYHRRLCAIDFQWRVCSKAAYPFQKTQGNQSYRYLRSASNKLNYCGVYFDTPMQPLPSNKLQGLFFDHFRWFVKGRLVTSARDYLHEPSIATISISPPSDFYEKFTKHLLPASAGIKNIFKIFRVDLAYRNTSCTRHELCVMRWDIIF